MNASPFDRQGFSVARAMRALVLALTFLILLAQIAPLIVVTLVSFSNSPVFEVTFGDWSFRWWERLSRTPGFWNATLFSLQLAFASTAMALILGSLAAIAIHGERFPGAALLSTVLLSPLMLPGIVLGIAVSQAYRLYGLTDPLSGLLVAHVIVGLPFVVRIMLSSLALFDFTMLDAARTLGRSYLGALWFVALPNLRPALVTSAVFAFLASFDNYPISIFLVTSRTKTLPIQMLEFLEESPNPTIAAVSALTLALTAALLLILHRATGIDRAVAR